MEFLVEDGVMEETKAYYNIVIADDDDEVHKVTKMILKYFEFDDKRLKFYDAYSGQEAIELLEELDDVAVLFLDVVMEHEKAGLDVVKYIREDQGNAITRIILRTGQPGEAPEEEIIRDYDINDYRLKTELTVKRLHTSLYSALRNYRDLMLLNKNRLGLEKIIKASAKLFEHNSLQDFLTTMLSEISNFTYDDLDIMYIREGIEIDDGVVILEQSSSNKIIAATGKYLDYINLDITDVDSLSHVDQWIHSRKESKEMIHTVGNGFIIENRSKSKLSNYIYINKSDVNLDTELLNLFLSNFSIALDNYILNNMLQTTQEEIVFTLAETIESHFEENGSHTKRISEMMYQFAISKRYSYSESEMLKLASTMHDLGKVGIPDNILKKPGKLTALEFNVMKEHPLFGYNILKGPNLPIMKIASEIALNHHEKFDGSGYPDGKKGLEIPTSARMMAIVDVYDAMTHKRIYKEEIGQEETLKYIVDQKGIHFDPELVDIFINNLEVILNQE